MKHQRCSALILATALTIIGTRGVCMAEFSYRTPIDKSSTQEWNGRAVVERIGGFIFRVKRYKKGDPQITQITRKTSV